MHNTTIQPDAGLYALQSSRTGLFEVRLDAAAGAVSGAPTAQAPELAETIADCIAHAERLAFLVAGDLSADQEIDNAVRRDPAGGAR
jgi:hypothetical protein